MSWGAIPEAIEEQAAGRGKYGLSTSDIFL